MRIGIYVVISACIIAFVGGALALSRVQWQRRPVVDLPMSADTIKESMRRGDAIAMAIEQYAIVHNIYPDTLGRLVTEEFLPQIPLPVAGSPEWYFSSNRLDYELKFGSALIGDKNCPWPSYWRNAGSDEWHSDF